MMMAWGEIERGMTRTVLEASKALRKGRSIHMPHACAHQVHSHGPCMALAHSHLFTDLKLSTYVS